MRRAIWIASVVGIGMLLGALVYTSVSLFALHAKSELLTSHIYRLATASNVFRYGTILEVNHDARFVIVVVQRFPGDATKYLLHVPEGARIEQQTLVQLGDVAVAVAPVKEGQLTDLVPGTRVAFYGIKGENGFSAPVILFGNPL